MISLPVRVELQAGTSLDMTCSLTLPSFDFVVRPVTGDFLLLSKETEKPVVIGIRAIAHYDDGTAFLWLQPIICDNYDDMLIQLDWFKTRYEIEDITSPQSPEPYYILYRTVLGLLNLDGDSPHIVYDPDLVKIFAETCRTVWIANLYRSDTNGRLPLREDILKSVSETNDAIQVLHQMIFGSRSQYPNGIAVRRVIKDWDALINQDKCLTWDVDDDLCEFIGGVIFSRLKCDKPHFLREV
jgi:hypothetical protein